MAAGGAISLFEVRGADTRRIAPSPVETSHHTGSPASRSATLVLGVTSSMHVLEFVSEHFRVDLIDPKKRTEKINWIRNGGPGREAFAELHRAYLEHVRSGPLVTPLDRGLFRPYISSELQSGLLDLGLGLTEYGHDNRGYHHASEVMRYLLMYCDGIVIDSPMRFFVDKAAMFDQPSLAANARDRLVSFLHFVCDYAPLVESGAVSFLEHNSDLHNHSHSLYSAGEDSRAAMRRLGALSSETLSPEEDPRIVEGYLGGQLFAWAMHEGRFNVHAPGHLARRMLEDRIRTAPLEPGTPEMAGAHLEALERLVEIGLPRVADIRPETLLSVRRSDQMGDLREQVRGALLAISGRSMTVTSADLQAELRTRIDGVVKTHGKRGIRKTLKTVGFSGAGALLGGLLAGPVGALVGKGIGVAAGAMIGASAPVAGEAAFDAVAKTRDPLAQLVVVLSDPRPSGRR